MRRLSALLLALLLALVTAACGGGDDDAGETADTATSTAPDEDGGGEDAVAFRVELLDAGAAPHRTLRLAPPADCHQPVRQTVQLDQRISAEGEVQEASSAFVYDITYDCEAVGDGQLAVTMTYDDIRIVEDDSGASATFDEMMGPLIGSSGRIVYDDRGQVVDVDLPEIEFPEDNELGPEFAAMMQQLLDQLETSVDQAAAPFPEEPIGVGGRFRVSGQIELSGLVTRYTTEYVIRELDGDRVVADTTTNIAFPPGPVELPGLPEGASAEIVSGELNGTGSTTWDLRGVAAYQDGETEGTTVMRLEGRGETIEMEQRQRQVLRVEPR